MYVVVIQMTARRIHVCCCYTDDCKENPCMYGGTCSDLVADVHCDCADGFTGTRCETRPATGSLCNPGPCGDKGKCVQDYTTNTVHCICEPGFTSGKLS